MEIEQIVITIFGVIGFIFILLVIYYYLAQFYQRTRDAGKNVQWPPASYMVAAGAQCPDYWVNAGNVGGGYHKCVNKFNLPVNKSSSTRCSDVKCFDENENSKLFRTVRRWPVRRNQIRSQCLWRDCCGPEENIPASWVGISDTCGY